MTIAPDARSVRYVVDAGIVSVVLPSLKPDADAAIVAEESAPDALRQKT
ncbi:hypothetical protein [Klebsiella pneumoniae IS22]|nr:hypothetical protein [Klebsiella pneumoniae IS22]